MGEMIAQLQILSDRKQQIGVSLVTVSLSKMLVALVKLSLPLGLQCHLGVTVVHCVTHTLWKNASD